MRDVDSDYFTGILYSFMLGFFNVNFGILTVSSFKTQDQSIDIFYSFFMNLFHLYPYFSYSRRYGNIYIYKKNLRGDAIDTAVSKTKIKTVSHVAPILLLINNIYYCSFASVSTRSWGSVITILSCFLYRNQCRSNFALRLDPVLTDYFKSY